MRLYDKEDTFRAMPENFVTEIYLGEVQHVVLRIRIFLALGHTSLLALTYSLPPLTLIRSTLHADLSRHLLIPSHRVTGHPW